MPHSARSETQCKVRGARSEPDGRCTGIGLVHWRSRFKSGLDLVLCRIADVVNGVMFGAKVVSTKLWQ
jgi:hypothetical protein